MAQINVLETAETFKNKIFTSEIQTFARCLSIPYDFVEKCRLSRQIEYPQRDLIFDILKFWINANGSSGTVESLTTILRAKKWVSIAGALEEIHYEYNDSLLTSFTNQSFKFDVISPTDNFVGRRKELDLLFDSLISDEKHLVFISGIGGQGKSELCRHFLQKLPYMFGVDKKTQEVKSWFDGKNSKCFSKDISDFCKAIFNISSNDAKEQNISALIENIPNEKLESYSNWIVVIDDVDEIYEELNMTIRALLKKNAFVIVTSRKTYILEPDPFLTIKLQPLYEEEAIQLVKNSLSEINVSKYELQRFCEALLSLPSALQQAVDYIEFKQKTSDYGILKYLEELESDENIELLEFNHSKGPTPYQIIKGILDHIREAKKESSNALKLFKFLALIKIDLDSKYAFEKYFSSLDPGKSFQESLKILEEFHLVKNVIGKLSIPTLVQRIGIHHMKLNCKWEETVDEFLKYFIENISFENNTILQNIWNFGAFDSKWIGNNVHILVLVCENMDKIKDNKLNNFVEKNLNLMQIKLGEEHMCTMKFEYYIIAKLNENKTRLKKLRSLHERQKQALGESHEDTLITASQIPKNVQNLRIKTVDKFLGCGSFGYVFHSSQHNCAMKLTIIDETGKSKKELVEERERLDREYNIIIEKTRTNDHPNLVKLYTFTELKLDNEVFKKLVKIKMNDSAFFLLSSYSAMIKRRGPVTSLCIEMELCGKNLREWLNSSPIKSSETSIIQIGIVEGIVQGLGFLHQNKVIHRDLRPENIMFTHSSRENYQLPVKIGDFGLCRKIHTEETKTKTYTKNPGHPSYNAPETQTSEYGFQADLYSLGFVIWEVLQLIKFKDIGNIFYALTDGDEDKLETVIDQNLPIEGAAKLIISLTRRRLQDRIKSIEEVLPYLSHPYRNKKILGWTTKIGFEMIH